MRKRKTYVDLFVPILLSALVVTAWLCRQAAVRYAEGQAVYTVSVSLPDGEITGDLLSQMRQFPGFCGYRAMYCQEADFQIGRYHAQTEIWGIELEDGPLTVTRSAGKKRRGTKPLLIVGESFFKELLDAREAPISEYQAQMLANMPKEQAVTLTVGASKEKKAEAELLGVVQEDGVYMEARQMKDWLASMGCSCRTGRALLRIRGSKNAQNVCESLQNAGFTVEMK